MNTKKLLAVLLSASIIFPVVPCVSAQNAETAEIADVQINLPKEADNIQLYSDQVFEIATEDDLIDFANQVNAGNNTLNAKLTADITLIKEFIPISVYQGDATVYYQGTFDGNGYSINNVSIISEQEFTGLFGYIGSLGVVKNLTVSGSVTGVQAGGISGYNKGTISNVIAKIDVFGGTYSGGIVGYNDGTVEKSKSLGVKTSGNGIIGGIAAVSKANAVVTQCENHGDVNGYNYYDDEMYAKTVGGIVGNNSGSVTSCCNYNEVSGGLYGGGICGQNNGTLSDCSNHNTVRVLQNYIGGICGYSTTDVTNCYNTGNFEGLNYAGGICGYSTAVIDNCKSLYCGNDDEINNYAGGICGNSTGTVKNCEYIGEIHGKNYVGGICGKSNIIEDCTVEATADGYMFVGGVSGYATNLTKASDVRNSDINCTNTFGGGIVGYAVGNVENCSNNDTDVSAAEKYAGGIVGYLCPDHTVSYCENTGNVTSGIQFAGGIVGQADGGTIITNCSNTGNITSASCAGGILGAGYSAINNCYSVADITGYMNGGIIGYANEGALISNCYQYGEPENIAGDGSVSVTDSYYVDDTNSSTAVTKEYLMTDEFLAILNANSTDAIWSNSGMHKYYHEVDYPVFVWQLPSADAIAGYAYVDSDEEFYSALSNNEINTIVLSADVSLNKDVTIDRNITVKSKNHYSISGNEYSINVQSDLTLSDIAIYNTSNFNINEHTLTCYGYVVLPANINLTRATADISQACVSVYETLGNPTFIADETSKIIGNTTYYDTGYYLSSVYNVNEYEVDRIVIPSDENDGITYDITPTYMDSYAYFYLPCRIDINNVIYYTVDKDGNRLTRYNENLADNVDEFVQVKGNKFKIKAMQSQIPTMHFNIDEENGTINDMNTSADHSSYTYGDAVLDVTDETAKEKGWDTTFSSVENDDETAGTVKIRGRGNSSWSTLPQHQKSYQIKFEKKSNLLNMGKAKTWVLVKSSQNNYISNKLSLDIAKNMGIEYVSDSEFVDVFMNGNYIGTYILAEKVEIGSERVDLTDLEEDVDDNGITENTDLTGGYLVEIDNAADELKFTTNGYELSVKNPDNLSDDATATTTNSYQYIVNTISDLFDAVYGDGLMKDGKSYLQHINIESFVRYYWQQEFISNLDCGLGSTFFYKDSDSVDTKIYAGPVWDSDRAFQTANTEGFNVPNIVNANNVATFYNKLLKRKDFADYVVWYYENTDLKDIFANSVDLVNEYSEYIKASADMNSARWDIAEYDKTSLLNFITGRSQWIDDNYTLIKTNAVTGDNLVSDDSLSKYEITNVNKNDTTVTADIYNNTADVADGLAIMAMYKDGSCVDVKMQNIEDLPCGSNIKVSADTTNTEYDTVKVFLWNNTSELIPLTAAGTLIK